MATHGVFHNFRAALLRKDTTGPTDGQLLGRFIEERDDDAFAALIGRHGPLVWGVCRRLLAHHDAEDAFQATFLVLARKAASVKPREMVANWLHGVARRAALQAARTAARRRRREQQVVDMHEPAETYEDRWLDLQPLLDEELSCLPDKYRNVIVLCDLEGRSRKEVSRQLGVPEGSVAGWLARARAILAKRLTQRGVQLSAGALTALLSQNIAAASVPAAVMSATMNIASPSGAGPATGTIPARVSALTEGVLKTMLLSKLKLTMVLLLASVLLGGAALASIDPPVVVPRKAATAGTSRDDKPARKPAPTDKDRLQGTWQAVEVAVRGHELEKIPEEKAEKLRAVFSGDKLEWRGFQLTFTLDPSRKPKQMDWKSTEGAEPETMLAIYELEGDTLKICMANPGEDRPTQFKSVAGSDPEGDVKVLVFKKLKKTGD